MRFLLTTLIVLFSVFLSEGQAQVDRSEGAVNQILRVYPNPATSFVNLEFQQSFDKGFSLQVYNFLGKKMYESSNVNQRTSLNLSDYLRGVYIYQLRDRNGKMVESGKFHVSK
jgi:hypothetical protein